MRLPAAARIAPTIVTARHPYLQRLYSYILFIYKFEILHYLSVSQVAMGPVIKGTAWNIETIPAVAAEELPNSSWNCSNMMPKLKVTPSAIMLTKKEAATTTQP